MKELDSYLNDHLAGSVGALELVDHWSNLCDGKPLATFLADLRKGIEADQELDSRDLFLGYRSSY